MDPHLEEIKKSRQAVYGDPLQNHQGIAAAWSGLLQPHWEAIRDGRPIPSWTVAHMMAALKLNRMRITYHPDNYDDITVYLQFAKDWQSQGTP
jgi:hypothetical protein